MTSTRAPIRRSRRRRPRRPPVVVRAAGHRLCFCRAAAPAVALAAALALSGCQQPRRLPPAEFSRAEAIARVNANNRMIGDTLQGRAVSARGQFRDHEAGITRHFDLAGGFLYRRPRFLYLDLRQLGSTVLQVGSNAEEFWVWLKPEVDTLWWGRYADLDDDAAGRIPVPPQHLLDALGLSELPEDSVSPEGPYFRVVDAYHQLLYVRGAEAGEGYVAREYWLDRWPPYLIRRLVLRDASGRPTMEADLDAFRRIRGSEALAAHRIRVLWPQDGARLDLHIGEYRLRPEVGPDSVAFRRRISAPREICVTAPPRHVD